MVSYNRGATTQFIVGSIFSVILYLPEALHAQLSSEKVDLWETGDIATCLQPPTKSSGSWCFVTS